MKVGEGFGVTMVASLNQGSQTVRAIEVFQCQAFPNKQHTKTGTNSPKCLLNLKEKTPKNNAYFNKTWNLSLLSILLSKIMCVFFSRHLVHVQVDFPSSLGPDHLVLWCCSATFWTASSCGARGCCAMPGAHLVVSVNGLLMVEVGELAIAEFFIPDVIVLISRALWCLHRTFLGT